jgi:hypothetical protein
MLHDTRKNVGIQSMLVHLLRTVWDPYFSNRLTMREQTERLLNPDNVDHDSYFDNIELDDISDLVALPEEAAPDNQALINEMKTVLKELDSCLQVFFGSQRLDSLERKSVGFLCECSEAIADFLDLLRVLRSRSWVDTLKTVGPEAFWADVGAFQYDSSNLVRQLSIITRLSQLDSNFISIEKSLVIRLWLFALCDSAASRTNSLGNALRRILFSLLQQLSHADDFSGLAGVYSFWDSDLVLMDHGMRLSLCRRVFQYFSQQASESRNRETLLMIRELFNACILPLPVFLRICLQVRGRFKKDLMTFSDVHRQFRRPTKILCLM